MREELVHGVPIVEVFDHVIASGVLTNYEQEEINSIGNRYDKMRKLLDYLYMKRVTGFHAFVNGLKSNVCDQNKKMATKLEAKLQKITCN